MTAALLVQSTVIGLSIGSIYILMALGLTLMFGMMHIINFAHGAVYMLGVFGTLDKHVPPVFSGTRNVLGVMISVERLMIIPIAGALVVSLYLFINKTRMGAAMRAIEQDKEAAALQGVNVNVINGLAFAVGFALAAAAGALMAPIFKLDPMMGEQPLLKAFIIIILGGLGSIPGAILGGLILGLIDSIVATALGAEPAFLLSFVFIILLLLFRPTGLFGHAP